MLEEYEHELGRVREENSQLRYQKEVSERDYRGVMLENNSLLSKLENLENIFVGAPIEKMNGGPPGSKIVTERYVASKVLSYCLTELAGSRECRPEEENT